MYRRLTITIALLALLAAACGGDDTSPTTAPGDTTAAGGETTTAAPTGSPGCEALITLDEAAALFGEPAMYDGEASQGIAQGVGTCLYSSIEDPDDLEDLTSHLLQVQVYRGEEYYAPDLVAPDAQPLEGIGEEAYVSGQLGVSTAFVDGDLVAFVTYSVIDLSGEAEPAITKRDQVIALLRLVHDRLT